MVHMMMVSVRACRMFDARHAACTAGTRGVCHHLLIDTPMCPCGHQVNFGVGVSEGGAGAVWCDHELVESGPAEHARHGGHDGKQVGPVGHLGHHDGDRMEIMPGLD